MDGKIQNPQEDCWLKRVEDSDSIEKGEEILHLGTPPRGQSASEKKGKKEERAERGEAESYPPLLRTKQKAILRTGGSGHAGPASNTPPISCTHNVRQPSPSC